MAVSPFLGSIKKSTCWSDAIVAALFNRTLVGLNVISFFMARYAQRGLSTVKCQCRPRRLCSRAQR